MFYKSSRLIYPDKEADAKRRKAVTKNERLNWIDNINNTAAAVASFIGAATVTSIFERYGVTCAEEASDSELPEIFSELYAIEADLK